MRLVRIPLRPLAAMVLLVWSVSGGAAAYDVVLEGGRVMDPETGLDAVRNVAIRGDRIAEISGRDLEGDRVIDVTGLVVAPGFIDLHAHGQSNEANAYQARDGVTTALELETGVPELSEWIEARRGRALINYGATASHMAYRALAKPRYASRFEELQRDATLADVGRNFGTFFGEAAYESLTGAEVERMNRLLKGELQAGALGIGLPVGYQPGASWDEIFELFRLAGEMQAPIFVHVRDPGVQGIHEVIANAAATGAPLHIVHINSMALGFIDHAIDLVEAAQAQGLDVTTELYPYTAGSTYLQSALFDEGWQNRLGGIGYQDIQWQATGERLTAATFEAYREQGGVVIIHMMKDEWIDAAIGRPSTMIASDGMPYAPGAHPRSAGTFSRVLGRYVRERQALSLMDAVRKMTLMPADRLAGIAPAARLKGRIQVGADADVTVFDPDRVIDTATFDTGPKFSMGIEYVLVNGVLVVDKGKSIDGARPGRPLLGRFRR